MNLDALTLAFVVTLGILVALLAAAATEAMRTRARVKRRIRPFGDLVIDEESDASVSKSIGEVGGQENPLIGWLESRFPLAGGVRTGTLALVALFLTASLLGPFFAFLGMGWSLAAPAAIVLGVFLGWNLGAGRENAKRIEFNDRFLLAMEDFQRMVRFGIPTMQALGSVASAAVEPVKPVLRNVLLTADLGVPIERAMAREARRVNITELAMLAAILSTQSSTGGNLSEAVGNLAAMLRERKDNRSKLQSSTAEARMTLIILGIIPFLGVGIQVVFQPGTLQLLLGEGRHLLGIGLALISTGFAVSYRMIKGAQK